jgi:chorismate mutase
MLLEELRTKIENIDIEILNLIDQRTNLAKAILDAKREEGKPINDTEQEKTVINKITEAAIEKGLDSESITIIFEMLIKMNVERQHEFSGEGNLP